MGRYFGTDGIRGKANQELTPLIAFKLGTALGKHLRDTVKARPKVLIGKDTRLSGDLLEGALIAGLCSMGTDVISVGVIPTPGIAYLTLSDENVNSGIVISASHNPMEDNGIKIFASDGRKLSDEVEDGLEDLMDDYKTLELSSGSKVGKLIKDSTLHSKYLNFLRCKFDINLKDMKIAVDCANGASSDFAKELFESMGATVFSVCHEPDGVNINDGCGSLHPETVCNLVKENNADLGCAFDGDADRVIMVDEKGCVVDGDRIMAIYALNRKRTSSLPADTVVGTVMSNIGLEKVLNKEGITLHRSNVGDRYVSEDMTRIGAIIGGEKSGHVIYSEHLPSGDGMLTALTMIDVLKNTDKPFCDLSDEIVEYPQLLVNVKVATKDGWDTNSAIKAAIENMEKVLEGRGRVVIRPSGTEPKIRVMAEGPDQAEIDTLVNEVANVIKKEQS